METLNLSVSVLDTVQRVKEDSMHQDLCIVENVGIHFWFVQEYANFVEWFPSKYLNHV